MPGLLAKWSWGNKTSRHLLHPSSEHVACSHPAMCVYHGQLTSYVYCYQGTHRWIKAVDTIYLWDWDVEVGSEGEDCSCQQHHKNCKCCILTGCQLKLEWCTYVWEHEINRLQSVSVNVYMQSYLHRSELHPPSNVLLWNGQLKSNNLPIGGQQILWECQTHMYVAICIHGYNGVFIRMYKNRILGY